MKPSYPKSEKLKSKKLIERLFAEGQAVTVFPLRLVALDCQLEDGVLLKVGVSVSKKRFNRAVDRNRIKRLLREAYRHNKSVLFNNIATQKALMILYIGSEIPDYKALESKMSLLFERFLDKDSTT